MTYAPAYYGDNITIWKNAPKIFHFKLVIPKRFVGGVMFYLNDTVINDNLIVDFCGLHVVEVGSNLPCLDPELDIERVDVAKNETNVETE